VIAISLFPSLPACLGHARDLAEITEIAQRDTGELELAIVALGTPRDFATMMNARLGRVARKLGELELRLEALFGATFMSCVFFFSSARLVAYWATSFSRLALRLI
jgi:hypothetical protein